MSAVFQVVWFFLCLVGALLVLMVAPLVWLFFVSVRRVVDVAFDYFFEGLSK